MKSIRFALCLSFLFACPAWAATVSAVKGQKTLVDLEGSEVHEGDEFFLMNAAGKKTGIIRIKQVKNNKAVADLIKGSAKTGNTLRAKGSATPTERPQAAAVKENTPAAPLDPNGRDMSYSRTLKPSYGALGIFNMDTMNVKVKDALSNKETVALKGTGLGAGGFYEWLLTRDITLRGLGAIEQFNAEGTASIPGCDSRTSTNCDAKIMYLSGYGLAKYYFNQNRIRTWAGLGGGLMIAVSKSSTALSTSDISTNQVLVGAVGFDWQLSRKNYIPVSIEYNYFPPSDTVTATVISIKAGYAWQ